MLAPAVLLLASLSQTEPALAATCTASPTPLALGTVTGSGAVDGSATITVTCNTTLSLSLLGVARVRTCLNIAAGVNGSGQTNPRLMTNSFGDTLQFQIYRDAARTQIWGDTTTPATPTPLGQDLEYQVPVLGGSSGNFTVTMYGRVPAQSGLAAGNYTNPFTGGHTRLDYRYAEALLILNPPYPASCTSGGNGGGSITFPFTASATVPDNCAISAADDLDFGSVAGIINANQDQTSGITFTCTGRTPWNIALSNGQNASGNTRRMRLGASSNYVTYELYRDPARSQRWGTTIGSDTVAGTGTGTTQSLTVYGRVPATQTIPAGSYSDVVTITVTY